MWTATGRATMATRGPAGKGKTKVGVEEQTMLIGLISKDHPPYTFPYGAHGGGFDHFCSNI